MTGCAPKVESSAQPSQGLPDARRIGVNLLFLTAGECLAKLVTFAAFSYLARVLGPRHYGNIEFTLAVMVFFTLPSDLGLAVYGAREIAKNPQHADVVLDVDADLLAVQDERVLSHVELLVPSVQDYLGQCQVSARSGGR